MYYRGIGIDKDYARAAALFEKAAEQGHGNAQYSLAVMYAFGQNKPKDYDKALEWFRKSAAQGIAQAQFNLGVFYENGTDKRTGQHCCGGGSTATTRNNIGARRCRINIAEQQWQ